LSLHDLAGAQVIRIERVACGKCVQSNGSADSIRKSLREDSSVDQNLRRISPTHKTKLQNQPVRYMMFFVNNLSSCF